MFPSSLYTHPRPFASYEPPVTRTPWTTTPPSPGSRQLAIRRSIQVEHQVVRVCNPRHIVDDRGSFSVRSPKETFVTENVNEALRYRHRMRARTPLRSATIVTDWLNHTPELMPSSPSSLCSLSPGSTPPTTPVDLPPSIEFPMVVGHRGDKIAPEHRPYRGSAHPQVSEGRWLRTSEKAERLLPAKPKAGYRPSRSRSSTMRQSLSRCPSCHAPPSSVSGPSAVSAGRVSSGGNFLALVKRLTPLPRFNPFRRARAESLSSIVDDKKVRLKDGSGASCRRRCKSDSAARL